jgi:hypothetical protein
LFFENLVTRGGLKPKWHSHFGNYIVNTLLALHKFQAKKQIYFVICIYVRVWIVTHHPNILPAS